MRVTDSLGSHCSTEPGDALTWANPTKSAHGMTLYNTMMTLTIISALPSSAVAQHTPDGVDIDEPEGSGAHRPSSGPVYRWPGPDPSSEPQGPVASLPRWSQSVSQSLSQHSQPLSAAQTIHGHCSPTLTVGSEDLPLLR